jgi:hypothetical protein
LPLLPSFFQNSIGWEYNILGEFEIVYYEDTKPPSRLQSELVLPRKVRYNMLQREWAVRNRDIVDAVRNNVRIKNNRKATVNNLDKALKMEIFLESAGRKLKRFVTFQKPVHIQVAEMMKVADAAQRMQSRNKLLTLVLTSKRRTTTKQISPFGVDAGSERSVATQSLTEEPYYDTSIGSGLSGVTPMEHG